MSGGLPDQLSELHDGVPSADAHLDTHSNLLIDADPATEPDVHTHAEPEFEPDVDAHNRVRNAMLDHAGGLSDRLWSEQLVPGSL
jgi:hypothetical protein